jgi:hypothetical protein
MMSKKLNVEKLLVHILIAEFCCFIIGYLVPERADFLVNKVLETLGLKETETHKREKDHKAEEVVVDEAKYNALSKQKTSQKISMRERVEGCLSASLLVLILPFGMTVFAFITSHNEFTSIKDYLSIPSGLLLLLSAFFTFCFVLSFLPLNQPRRGSMFEDRPFSDMHRRSHSSTDRNHSPSYSIYASNTFHHTRR